MEQFSILSAKFDWPVARQNFLLLARIAHDCEKQSRSTATETIKLITQDKKRTGICEIRLTKHTRIMWKYLLLDDVAVLDCFS